MANGQVSEPIAIPGGYSIVALIDKRQVLTSDPRDALLALKQVAISFPKGTSQAQAAPIVENFAKTMQEVKGCGQADDVGRQLGAEVVDNDQIRVRDLPPQPEQPGRQRGRSGEHAHHQTAKDDENQRHAFPSQRLGQPQRDRSGVLQREPQHQREEREAKQPAEQLHGIVTRRSRGILRGRPRAPRRHPRGRKKRPRAAGPREVQAPADG